MNINWLVSLYSVSRDQRIFVFAGVSAFANFLAILRPFGLLGNKESAGAPLVTKNRKWILAVSLFVVTVGLCGYGFYRVSVLESRLGVLESAHAKKLVLGWLLPDPICVEKINGRALIEYAEKYNLVIVCGLVDASADKYEDRRITVSSAWTIVPQDIEIAALFSEGMKAELEDALKHPKEIDKTAAGVGLNSWYEVVLLPKDVNPNDILRLSDVHRYAGKLGSVDLRTELRNGRKLAPPLKRVQ